MQVKLLAVGGILRSWVRYALVQGEIPTREHRPGGRDESHRQAGCNAQGMAWAIGRRSVVATVGDHDWLLRCACLDVIKDLVDGLAHRHGFFPRGEEGRRQKILIRRTTRAGS